MSIVPPLGYTARSGYQDPSYAAGEQLADYVGRLQRPYGVEPVMYFHGFFSDAANTLSGPFQAAFDTIAGCGHPVLVPELGGGSQWATPDVVGAGGHIDDALAYAGQLSRVATRTDKLGIYGASMGTTNAFPWAWERSGLIRAAVMVGPIVNLAKFYTDNASFQGAIDADWGSHAAFLAALPDIDPWLNIDRIRPWAHRLRLYYATDDALIDPDDVVAFAELTGATAVEFPGTHADLVAVPPDQVTSWLVRTMRHRQGGVIEWNDYEVPRIEVQAATLPLPANTNVLRTTVSSTAGRRGEWVRTVGGGGNERHGLLLPSAGLMPDSAVRTVWHSGDGGAMAGQQGNIHRRQVDEAAQTFAWYICWHNVLFAVPWIVNRGIWSGNIADPTTMVQPHTETSTIPGIRLAAGGDILASSRAGGVVTLVVHKADADRAYRSGVIDVVLPGIGNYAGVVTRVDDNHLAYTAAGADVTSGGVGSWADFASCFPYVADTELVGRTMRGRFYVPGQDPPDWGDPDWTFSYLDDDEEGPDGYGDSGWMAGHVGIFTPTNPVRVQFGLGTIQEL